MNTKKIVVLLLVLALCVSCVLVPASAETESRKAVVSLELKGERNVPSDPNPIPGGWAGAAVTIGQHDILLTQIGRMYFTGASLTHSFMVVNPDGSQVVEYCQMTVDAATPDSTFVYYTLPVDKQVTLKAGQTYYFCSDFWGEADRFYDQSTVISTEDVSFAGTVALNGDGSWSMTAAPGINMFPMDFGYTVLPDTPLAGFTPRENGAVQSISLKGEKNVPSDPAPVAGGWAATAVTVGSNDIILTQIGRMYFAGASLTHSFMVVKPDGTPVVEYCQMTVDAATPDSTFVYYTLPADKQVVLEAGQTYYFCSDFWGATDRHYNISTVTSAAEVSFVGTAVLNGTAWEFAAAPGVNMFPLDFCYEVKADEPLEGFVPAENGAVQSIILKNEKNVPADTAPIAGGWAGTAITVGAKDIVLTDIGRMYFAGASLDHTIMVVKPDGTPVVEAFRLTTDAATPDSSFVYYTLPADKQVVLEAGQTYYICSDFWGEADRHYASSIVTSTEDVHFTGTVALNSDGLWSMTEAPGVNMFPLDFCYEVKADEPLEGFVPAENGAVQSIILKDEKNVSSDPAPIANGWAGTAITVGQEDILLTGLGRMYFVGASLDHTIMVVKPDGTPVVEAFRLTTDAATPDSSFVYYTLPADKQVVLEAGQTYYICSDFWGEADRHYASSIVTSTEDVHFTGTVALNSDGLWSMTEAPGVNMFPLDLTYSTTMITGSQLELDGILNLKVTAQNGENCTLRVTIGTDTTSQTVVQENGLFTAKLPAHRMHESVKLELLSGGAVLDTKLWTMSSYTETLRQEYAGDTAMMTLLDDLNSYGSYAAYFADPTGTAPNVTAVESVQQAELKEYKCSIVTGDSTGLKPVTALYLDDACDLLVKFDETAFAGCTLTVDGTTVVPVSDGNGKVVYRIPELLPQDWSKLFNIKVTNADGVVVFEVNYSVLSYAYILLGKTQEVQTGLNGLMKAMWRHCMSATAYQAQKDAVIMQNGSGVAVTELNTLTEEHLSTLKKGGITFVKVHVPFPV